LESWAGPKTADGKLDHNKSMVGDDLRDFVNQKLFPYLHSFKQRATGPNTIEYKIGEIFGEIKNKIQSGYNLREIVEHIDELRFRSQQEKHELSHLYEAKIKNMGTRGATAASITHRARSSAPSCKPSILKWEKRFMTALAARLASSASRSTTESKVI